MGVLSLTNNFSNKRQRLLIALVALLSVLLFSEANFANAPLPLVKRSDVLPPRIGGFQLIGVAKQSEPRDRNGLPQDHLKLIVDADYGWNGGSAAHPFSWVHVSLFEWDSDSAAYAYLTNLRKQEGGTSALRADAIGTTHIVINHGVAFYKGSVSVTLIDRSENSPASTVDLARSIAEILPKGEEDIPVLVKHLPNWETTQPNALYVVDKESLRQAAPNEPVLDAISFEGGTEAVTANYGQSQLVIVEFTTPQFSIDNDSRIWTKIAELKSLGQPTPTAYRRVGNYSVFVFNAPDEKTANALVDQVKYEQVVQWLGDDPHLYERLQRYLTQTSAGALVAVLKSSGLSLLLCLAAGAFIGTMLFRYRRAQKAAAYSDAGGSIRLNLDELTGPANTRRLLKSENSSDHTSSNS